MFNIGLNQLREELESDHSGKSINSLCEKSGGRFKFYCFQSASPLEAIKIKFDIMFQQYPTEIFGLIWDAHMRKALKSEISIEGIKTQIWNPVFDECMTLLDSIHQKTIELNQVDHYFKALKDKKKREKELTQLHFGITQCTSGSKTKYHHVPWVSEAVNLMETYWSLRSLVEAAKVVITLKDEFNLTGDFKLIERLSSDQVFLLLLL